jgi:hypothetical protein
MLCDYKHPKTFKKSEDEENAVREVDHTFVNLPTDLFQSRRPQNYG